MKKRLIANVLLVLAGIILLSASSAWAGQACRADTNCDGIVSTPDLEIFEAEYYWYDCDPSTQCLNCASRGMIECGDTCVDHSTDEGNCGTCGNSCVYGEICYNGNCYVICEGCGCPPGLIDCGGTCVDNSTDEGNCSTCGNSCVYGEICYNGNCLSPIPAPVPKTGQTTLYATGDDGDLEKGVAWPDPRFTDNGDGTVTDNLTGLLWLKNANCFGEKNWSTALTDCNTLHSGECEITDNSTEGDWRLPNRFELESLLDLSNIDTALPSGHPFTGVKNYGVYWSGTSYAYFPDFAWHVGMYDGVVIYRDKIKGTGYVWPVRSDN